MEEFFLAKRVEIQKQLEYRWISAAGKDISDILRGKLEILDTFLDLKNIFANMDRIEKQIKDIEDKIKEGAK